MDFSHIFRLEVIVEDIDHNLAEHRGLGQGGESVLGPMVVAAGGAVKTAVVAGAWRALRKTSRSVAGSMHGSKNCL